MEEDMKQNVLNWNAYWLSQHVAGQPVKPKQKTPGNKQRHTHNTQVKLKSTIESFDVIESI